MLEFSQMVTLNDTFPTVECNVWLSQNLIRSHAFKLDKHASTTSFLPILFFLFDLKSSDKLYIYMLTDFWCNWRIIAKSCPTIMIIVLLKDTKTISQKLSPKKSKNAYNIFKRLAVGDLSMQQFTIEEIRYAWFALSANVIPLIHLKGWWICFIQISSSFII